MGSVRFRSELSHLDELQTASVTIGIVELGEVGQIMILGPPLPIMPRAIGAERHKKALGDEVIHPGRPELSVWFYDCIALRLQPYILSDAAEIRTSDVSTKGSSERSAHKTWGDRYFKAIAQRNYPQPARVMVLRLLQLRLPLKSNVLRVPCHRVFHLVARPDFHIRGIRCPHLAPPDPQMSW